MGLCQDMAAKYWPPSDVDVAQAVCMAESGGNPNAWNRRGEDSRGLWQINVAAHPQWAYLNLFDPDENARVAYQLWQAQGWQPWAAYTTGAYRKYLTGAAPAGNEQRSNVGLLFLLVAALLLLGD